MKHLIKTLAGALVLLAAVGCNQSRQARLSDGEWILSSMHNDNGIDETISTNRPTLLFSDSTSQFSGYGGCNNFFGDYRIDNKKLTIDTKGITQALCLDMSTEERLLGMLRNVESYKIHNDQLILYGENDRELARFDRNY